MELHNNDCFVIFKDIKKSTIDLVVVDLPYGQTACYWDTCIDLNQMWTDLKRICKQNAIYCFFCTTKFGNSLINSNPRWFRYDIVWEKSNPVGHLSANKCPLRRHEMIYIFSKPSDNVDLENNKNIELREYASKVKKYINKPNKEIYLTLGNKSIQRFYNFRSKRFGLPTLKTYNQLIEHFNIDNMEGFIPYDRMKKMWEKLSNPKTYNPQKTKGKPYKRKGSEIIKDVYGQTNVPTHDNKTGDRYPTSIIKFNNHINHKKQNANHIKSLHRTEKPVPLCEWLIKSYSNENDLVLDFTMGSGTTGEACKNTNRRFIGVEIDKEIFKIAHKRLI